MRAFAAPFSHFGAPSWRISSAMLSAVTMATLVACANDAPPTVPPNIAPRTSNYSISDITTPPIPWNQSSVGSGHGHARFGTALADDFIIPTGRTLIDAANQLRLLISC